MLSFRRKLVVQQVGQSSVVRLDLTDLTFHCQRLLLCFEVLLILVSHPLLCSSELLLRSFQLPYKLLILQGELIAFGRQSVVFRALLVELIGHGVSQLAQTLL